MKQNKMKKKMQEMPAMSKMAKAKSCPSCGGEMPMHDDNMVSEDSAEDIAEMKPKSLKDLKKVINAKSVKGE